MPDANGEPTTKENIFIKKGESALRIWKPYEVTYVEVPQEDGKTRLAILSHLPKEAREKAKEENWKTRKSVKFQLVPVFDISQTTASPEAYPKFFGFGGSTYRDAEEQFRAVKNYAENTLNCPVTVEDLGSRKTSVRGFFVPDDNRIVISDMLSGDAKLSTLIHEVGHAELHGDNAENAKKSEAQIELEADMYSLMIESRLGIEPTEARCRHLGTHYEMYLEEIKAKLPEGETLDLNSDMEVLENVTKRYTERSALIDEYLSRQESIDAQMAAIERGGSVQTSKQSQTSVESDKPLTVADAPTFAAKI